jgi:hypothetical protein
MEGIESKKPINSSLMMNPVMMNRIIVITICLAALAAFSTAQLETKTCSYLMSSWHSGA